MSNPPNTDEIEDAILACENGYAINDARGIFRVLRGDQLVGIVTDGGTRAEIRASHDELAETLDTLGLEVHAVEPNPAVAR